jgi:hypothetical protein
MVSTARIGLPNKVMDALYVRLSPSTQQLARWLIHPAPRAKARCVLCSHDGVSLIRVNAATIWAMRSFYQENRS